jgi:transposase
MTRVQLTDTEWEFIEPYLPIGEYGPYPERLRQQFEGVIWRFRTGGQWREMPQEFGAWSTVHNRFRQWRDAGVFEALLEGLIAEAAKRGEVGLSLVSVDSTTARAHHDAAGIHPLHPGLGTQIAPRFDRTRRSPDPHRARAEAARRTALARAQAQQRPPARQQEPTPRAAPQQPLPPPAPGTRRAKAVNRTRGHKLATDAAPAPVRRVKRFDFEVAMPPPANVRCRSGSRRAHSASVRSPQVPIPSCRVR